MSIPTPIAVTTNILFSFLLSDLRVENEIEVEGCRENAIYTAIVPVRIHHNSHSVNEKFLAESLFVDVKALVLVIERFTFIALAEPLQVLDGLFNRFRNCRAYHNRVTLIVSVEIALGFKKHEVVCFHHRIVLSLFVMTLLYEIWNRVSMGNFYYFRS